MNKNINEICLLNDSFPPVIDGVANTVVNYTRVLQKEGYKVNVVTPEYPGADDSSFSFPVFRYPSIDLTSSLGYTAGNPFSIATQNKLAARDISILHSHCPIASNFVARQLKGRLDVPFVLTYHTKFDIDIRNAISGKLLQEGAIHAIVDSVSTCDELWVVSEGAGENIRSLGYQGDYVVMNNGVDMPKHRVSDDEIIAATKAYNLPENLPVFLFVGRLMWYKGIKIILDALAALKSQDFDFRMVFVGGGGDSEEIKEYTEKLLLGDKVIFTGPIRNREVLAAWYCRADLLLFPSTFDTNGLVVREAAACSLASVLVRGSCAAEGVTHLQNALLIDENAASLAVCLTTVMNNKNKMTQLGQSAADELYLSWDDSIKHAIDRYGVVIENYKMGKYEKKRPDLLQLQGELLEHFNRAQSQARELVNKIDSDLFSFYDL